MSEAHVSKRERRAERMIRDVVDSHTGVKRE
jgi:hypothetical protein